VAKVFFTTFRHALALRGVEEQMLLKLGNSSCKH